MRKTLALLVASTAMTATFGLSAWSATTAPFDSVAQPLMAVAQDGATSVPVLVSDDDDDDDKRDRVGRGHDDDDDDDHYDDENRRGSNVGNPAPAGTVAPPSNGLFGNGTPPKVQMN